MTVATHPRSSHSREILGFPVKKEVEGFQKSFSFTQEIKGPHMERANVEGKGKIKRGKVHTWAENRWCRVGWGGGSPPSLPTSLVARDQRVRLLRSSNKLSGSPKNSPSHEYPRLYREGFIWKTGYFLFFILVREVVGVHRWLSMRTHRVGSGGGA